MVIAGVLIGIAACNKNEDDSNVLKLEASKSTNIKKGEPVNFKFSQAPQGSTVQWTVVPDKDVKISATGNEASVLFANAGSYSVTAKYGSFTGTSDVSVQDSVYNPNALTTIVPLTGDQVAITISRMPDSMGLVGLSLSMETKNKYQCLNNRLLLTRGDVVENNITTHKITYDGVEIPGADYCTPGESVARSVTGFYPLAEGESILEIKLNGVLYTGKITKAGTKITISWSYTSGVTISPLILN